MALGAVLGAALTDHSARSKSLTIGGLDVLKQPGTAGNLYGVGIETVELTEAGPGQVSSLTFTIDDPLGVLTVQAGAYVRFEDLTLGLPLFAGFIESVEPYASGIARNIGVTCVGIEIVLDWMYVPSFTITGTVVDIAQAIIGQATGIGVNLRVAGTNVSNSTQAVPIGILATGTITGFIVPAGTVRQALAALAGAAMSLLSLVTTNDAPATVDFYHGLRMALKSSVSGWGVTDYSDQIISVASGHAPSGTVHRVDGSGATRQVWIIGGNAAGTGIVSDGSGLPGAVAQINDPNSTTAEYKLALGLSYLLRNGSTIAGNVTADDAFNVGVLGAELRAGIQIVVTDVNLGLTASTQWTTEIRKTFTPDNKERWTFTYGGRVSGAQYLRRLTRAVINN